MQSEQASKRQRYDSHVKAIEARSRSRDKRHQSDQRSGAKMFEMKNPTLTMMTARMFLSSALQFAERFTFWLPFFSPKFSPLMARFTAFEA
jgi:hypothetical protein